MTNQNKPQSKSAKEQEIIRVTNDAMAPQILPGDILFLERQSNNNVIYGLPYVVITKGSHIYIRRIYWYTGGCYSLVSDNAAKYPDKVIDRDKIESIITIVKAVRYMSERIEFI